MSARGQVVRTVVVTVDVAHATAKLKVFGGRVFGKM